MGIVLATLLGLALVPPAEARAQRAPIVSVEHVRGPIGERELRGAWPGRRFSRCRQRPHDDIAQVSVRVEIDGSVHVERGLAGDYVRPELRCVLRVLTRTRLRAQTAPTYARVTIYFFRPTQLAPARLSVRSPGSRPPPGRPRR